MKKRRSVFAALAMHDPSPIFIFWTVAWTRLAAIDNPINAGDIQIV
jgi:hypothetical protein